MAAAHCEAKKREGGLRCINKMCQYVGLHVIDLDDGDIQCRCHRLGKRHPHQQSPQQPRPTCEGDGLQVVARDTRLCKSSVHYGHDIFLVLARGQLRHYASIKFVYLLVGNDIGENFAILDDCCRGLVARRLDG